MSGASIRYEVAGEAKVDPRWHYYQQQLGCRGRLPNYGLADRNEIPVVGKIRDLSLWNERTDVRLGVAIPKEGEWIVTARIPANRFEELRGLPYVTTLKVAQVMRPFLRETVKEIGLVPPSSPLSSDLLAQQGEGVVVGIVDYGCDFAHTQFRIRERGTRLLSIWNQGGAATATSPHGYGRLYTRQEINLALGTRDPYRTLGYKPEKSSHGTHVMDIAIGNGPQWSGVAPKAEGIFVELSEPAERTIQEVLDRDFGDSVRVIEAVHHIFQQAGDRPCVVNLSLGTNGGPHDGTNPVEEAFDAMVREKNNRAIVIAASNSFSDKIHQSGTVAQGRHVDLAWKTSSFDQTHNETEIWYSGKDVFTLEVLLPTGQSLASVPLGQNGTLQVLIEGRPQLVGFISHRKDDPNNHDNVIHLFQDPRLMTRGGVWTLRLHGTRISSGGGQFHAWIERDDQGPTSFEQDDTRNTLGSIASGHLSIAVGSYDAHRSTTPISYFSSAGPTRDGRQKPEVSAPGHDVMAADALSRTGAVRMSGTSMAAPAVTGLVARILGRALQQRRALSVDQIRELLTSTARRRTPTVPWDSRFGFGRVSAEAIGRVPAGSLPAAAASASDPGTPAVAAASPRSQPKKRRAEAPLLRDLLSRK